MPQRETGTTPYEMMLSESQERMLMVLKPGREGFAKAIFLRSGNSTSPSSATSPIPDAWC
ncbi:hypothetical protein AB5I41_12260 [Sphingomonas sp. MMS24-JH45]